MPLAECANRHLYNRDKYGDTCPICGLVSKKTKEEGKTKEEIDEMYRIPEERYHCGWLVCTDGINKGRSYPIHPGKNFIGSRDDMDIQILGDKKIDERRHAVVAFDSKTLVFTLLPGESTGLVYLEDEAVFSPKKLELHAKIELGASTFMFFPCCDGVFSWSK